LFAYVHPFTRTDIEKSVEVFEAKMHAHGVYCHKEVLIESLEGHPLHMLTVTAQSSDSQEDDKIIDPNFALYNKGGTRPARFAKQTIFISSRVHCGETVASFFLQGMFDLLAGYSEQAKLLLERYVFKIVPLLNPDGVERGYWRNDTQGLNLNRVYSEPDPVLHPTIYATKAAILHEFKK